MNIAENLRRLLFQHPLHTLRPAEAFEQVVGKFIITGDHHAAHFVLHALAHRVEAGIFQIMGEQIGLNDKRLDQTGALQRHLRVDLCQRAVGDQVMHQPGGAFVPGQTSFAAQLAHTFIDGIFQRCRRLGGERQGGTEAECAAATEKLSFIQQHGYEW